MGCKRGAHGPGALAIRRLGATCVTRKLRRCGVLVQRAALASELDYLSRTLPASPVGSLSSPPVWVATTAAVVPAKTTPTAVQNHHLL